MPDEPYDPNPELDPATSARITQTLFSVARAMSEALASCSNPRLARAAGIQGSCRSMAGVALSAAVATELEGLGWRRGLVADAPTEVAILKTLEDLEVEVRRSGALNP